MERPINSNGGEGAVLLGGQAERAKRQFELANGIRCACCEERITAGWEYGRARVVVNGGEGTILQQTVHVCDRAACTGRVSPVSEWRRPLPAREWLDAPGPDPVD